MLLVLNNNCIEVWLSLVERCVRDAEAAGSSPVTSTIDSRIYKIRFVSHLLKENHRGVAQVVAHQTGGLGVASSSLVTPTKKGGFPTVFFLYQKRLKRSIYAGLRHFLKHR